MGTKSIIEAVIWTILVLMTSMVGHAQTVTGCVIYEGNGTPRMSAPIYVTATGSTTGCNGYTVRIYQNAGSAPLSTYCINIPNISPALRRDCVVGTECGNIRTVDLSGIDCDLDNSVLYIVVASLMVGMFFIRRRPK